MQVFVRSLWLTALLIGATASAWAADGDLDLGFGENGVALVASADSVFVSTGLVVQTDGKILFCGTGPSSDGSHHVGIVSRLNADGSPDRTFGDAGHFELDTRNIDRPCAALALQRDGKIVVATQDVADETAPVLDVETHLVRLETGGTRDLSFGDGGVSRVNFIVDDYDIATALAIQPDGAIVLGVATRPNRLGIARVREDGSNDSSFGVDGRVTIQFPLTLYSIADVSDILVDPQERIVVTGSITIDNVGRTAFAAARVLRDGTIDRSFGSGGGVMVAFVDRSAAPYPALLQDDGRIVLAGWAATLAPDFGNETYNVAAVCLLDDGTLDPSFGSGGMRIIPLDLVEAGAGVAVAGVIRRDRRIVLVGHAQMASGPSRGFMLQLDEHGNDVEDFATQGARIFDVGPDERNALGFTGIAMQGSKYIIGGTALRERPYLQTTFAVRVDGPLLRGHSKHQRPPPIPARTHEVAP